MVRITVVATFGVITHTEMSEPAANMFISDLSRCWSGPLRIIVETARPLQKAA